MAGESIEINHTKSRSKTGLKVRNEKELVLGGWFPGKSPSSPIMSYHIPVSFHVCKENVSTSQPQLNNF